MNDIMEPAVVETAARHFPNEELHPDLRCSLRAMGGCWMIHHPVMVQYYVPGEDIARINHAYTAKRDYIAKVEAEGEWDTYMCLHERAYRIDVFDGIKHRLSDKQYWETLGWLYTDQEFASLWTDPRLAKIIKR